MDALITSWATQVGVGGIFLILIVREVGNLVAKRNGQPSLTAIGQMLADVQKHVDDLYDWHNQTDPRTGAKIWYVQQSLEDAIRSLDQTLQKLGSLLDKHTELLRGVEAKVVRLDERVQALQQ